MARIPDTEDGLTLLAKYHREWIVYRDQIQYIPGPFRPLEEDMLNRSDVSEQLDEDEVSVGISFFSLKTYFFKLISQTKFSFFSCFKLVKSEFTPSRVVRSSWRVPRQTLYGRIGFGQTRTRGTC